MTPVLPASVRPPDRPSPAKDDAAFRTAARNLEATFLAEMLKSSGIGKARQSFGGGIGEEMFSSQLADVYARRIVERGGIGLAESIYRSLRGQADV